MVSHKTGQTTRATLKILKVCIKLEWNEKKYTPNIHTVYLKSNGIWTDFAFHKGHETQTKQIKSLHINCRLLSRFRGNERLVLPHYLHELLPDSTVPDKHITD